ncbi:MAG: hypothetical protein EG824_00275 [Deltaproteobacteria bacterium]|nr:hypothetical protein [Deltaproteobacteria bacterium]
MTEIRGTRFGMLGVVLIFVGHALGAGVVIGKLLSDSPFGIWPGIIYMPLYLIRALGFKVSSIGYHGVATTISSGELGMVAGFWVALGLCVGLVTISLFRLIEKRIFRRKPAEQQ